jgi:predicted dehydrogenase
VSTKLRWGVLSTASIALNKVIPAMQRGHRTTVHAIASRDLARAQRAAIAHDIPLAYGSYDELLKDPDVDAVYIPLPNHLHVPWAIKAAEAGKHILCEKPIALTAQEAALLLDVRTRCGVKIGEAFMIRTYPQWLRVRELIEDGRIGELRSVAGFFSYFDGDPGSINNKPELGGGGLLDIGCYLVHASRYAFAAEPARVVACIDRDPNMGTDRLTSAILDFGRGQCIFTCSTQLVPYQRIHFIGTRGRIELEIPFNAPTDIPVRLLLDEGGDVSGTDIRVEELAAADQYTLQGDAFSQAVLEDGEVPVPLEDSIGNMRVIDTIFRSARTGMWEVPGAESVA